LFYVSRGYGDYSILDPQPFVAMPIIHIYIIYTHPYEPSSIPYFGHTFHENAKAKVAERGAGVP
jgi:hypothetical protein